MQFEKYNVARFAHSRRRVERNGRTWYNNKNFGRVVCVNMKNILITIGVGAVLLFAGYILIDTNHWTGSAILYLAAVVGAGCYWIGSNQNK